MWSDVVDSEIFHIECRNYHSAFINLFPIVSHCLYQRHRNRLKVDGTIAQSARKFLTTSTFHSKHAHFCVNKIENWQAAKISTLYYIPITSSLQYLLLNVTIDVLSLLTNESLIKLLWEMITFYFF